MELAQVLINGILMGLIYALTAVGLTLIWGVMDLANFAHGEFLMLGMYMAYWMHALFNVDPLLTLPLAAIVFFFLGKIVYRTIIKPVMTASDLSRILVTFGLGIVLSNTALFLWSPNFRTIAKPLLSGTIVLGAMRFPSGKLVVALISLVLSAALYYTLTKTRMGRALQALAMDADAAVLVGVNVEKMRSTAFGLGVGCAGLAGCLLAEFSYVSPTVGAVYSLLAFASVTLGGFGSVPGALAGAVIIGLTEALGGFFVGAAYKYALVYGIFLLVVIVRPKGLMGW